MQYVFLEVGVVFFIDSFVEAHEHAVCQDEESTLLTACRVTFFNLNEIDFDRGQVLEGAIK